MEDRLSASIAIHGILLPELVSEPIARIGLEGYSTQLDGALFAATTLPNGSVPDFTAHDFAWGRSEKWKRSASPTCSILATSGTDRGR